MRLKEIWKFTFETPELSEAIQKKLDFHGGRKEFWQAKQVEVMAKLKEAGVKVTESLVSQYSSASNTFNHNMSVQLDHDLQQQLTESNKKLEEHRVAIKTYGQWGILINRCHKNRTFDLSYDDYVFFFGT